MENSRDKICQITSDTLVPTLVSQILADYASNDHGQWRSNDLCNARDEICQITSDTLISQIFFSIFRYGYGIALVYKNTAILQKGCH